MVEIIRIIGENAWPLIGLVIAIGIAIDIARG